MYLFLYDMMLTATTLYKQTICFLCGICTFMTRPFQIPMLGNARCIHQLNSSEIFVDYILLLGNTCMNGLIHVYALLLTVVQVLII